MITFGPAPGRLAPDRRVYAVGDVHGCAERLLRLHDAISRDLSDRPVAEATLVHLGDYVDRGPDVAGVVRHLLGGDGPKVARTVNLMGNHEDMMLAALADPSGPAPALWLMNGGEASLRSWGTPPLAPAASWAGLVPPEHLQFLRGLGLHHRVDDYLFVHAGLRPGRPLAEQEREDLLWIRDPFLASTETFQDGGDRIVVVHGHTPVRSPAVRPNRIGIDTGAVMGGKLSCAVLEENRLGFLSA